MNVGSPPDLTVAGVDVNGPSRTFMLSAASGDRRDGCHWR